MSCSEAVVERKALEHCAERNSSAMSLPSKLNAAHKVYTAFLSGKQTGAQGAWPLRRKSCFDSLAGHLASR
jgi:hypothetical protein